MAVTVEARTAADPVTAWAAWTEPGHITKWNFANDDWCCPSADVDLRTGGRYASRMEAKDGSMGFDFAATITELDAPRRLAYRLDDDRLVAVEFAADGDGTHVTQRFEAEAENDVEMQRAGWQAILDNFARYAGGI